MQCKKCGAEIREGCLFCHQCGEEVRIVPDYEPDLEELKIGISEEKEKKAEKIPVLVPEKKNPEKKPSKHPSFMELVRWRYFASAALLLVGLGAFAAAYLSVLKKQSPEAMQDFGAQAEEELPLPPPKFSREGGEYGYYLSVELSAGEGQKIYYTTDGTVPDETSFLYKSPIELSEGVTVVRAFVLDADGNASEPAEETYILEFGVPDPPSIFPKSGQYAGEKYVTIVVPEGCAAFYTLDGSEPDEYSEIYTGEFLMPEGSSTVRAVLIDRKGAFSEVTTVHYERLTEDLLPETTEEAPEEVPLIY